MCDRNQAPACRSPCEPRRPGVAGLREAAPRPLARPGRRACQLVAVCARFEESGARASCGRMCDRNQAPVCRSAAVADGDDTVSAGGAQPRPEPEQRHGAGGHHDTGEEDEHDEAKPDCEQQAAEAGRDGSDDCDSPPQDLAVGRPLPGALPRRVDLLEREHPIDPPGREWDHFAPRGRLPLVPYDLESVLSFFSLSSWELAVIIFAVVASVTAGGVLLGRRLREHHETLREPFGVLQAALLGVVRLILAFALSLALGRSESRRAAVVSAANAIGATCRPAQLLAEPDGARSVELLRRYTNLALKLSHEVPNSAAMGGTVVDEDVVQRRLWD